MALRKKIDSNETSLYYAEEQSLGVLPGSPVWRQLEPNEYDDFGGELTLLARNPINSSRQRKKGVITDLDASGGFQQDFTQTNMQDLLQGFMFADMRDKGALFPTAVTNTQYTVADNTGIKAGMLLLAKGFANPANNGLKKVTGLATTVGVQVAGLVAEAGPLTNGVISVVGLEAAATELLVNTGAGLPYLEIDNFDFTDFGIIPGEWIYVGGDAEITRFATAGNNGFKRVRSVGTDRLTLDTSMAAMGTDAGTGKTIRLFFGNVLKNETGALVKRRSYQIERQLGAPDTANLSQVQAEYLTGAVANELEMSMETADKITVDLSFIGTDVETRTGAIGVKDGTRPPLVESDAFNTSSDISFVKLFIRDMASATADPLFAYLTELSISINNNVSPNKAIGVLGAFDVTAGTFEVSAGASAYFSTVEAVNAVRRNSDCSFCMGTAKANAGFVLDLPLVAIGEARNEVELDEPIMLPMTLDAATAAKLAADLDYTLLWVFFDYLPTVAEG